MVANYANGRLATIDKIKEMVRLADGLGADGALDAQATARALDCLTRFGQRLRHLPPENVRVVGTNTLRKAKGADRFLKRAQRAVNHTIDIISGTEEARIIFMGVSYALEDAHKRRLVFDIGGGSTEVAAGKRFKPMLTDSLYMGCVSMSQAFFGDGIMSAERFEAARNRARQELEGLSARYRAQGWDTAIGASGTIAATGAVLEHAGLGPGISRDGLKLLRARLIDAGHIGQLSLQGLGKDRAPVFPGGVAIIQALFDEFELDGLRVSDGALREGLLYDLVGRVENHDVRASTVDDLIRRYHIDQHHAERTETCALQFLDAVAAEWNIGHAELRRALGWAARLHEIGLDISHSQYHKHGAYLLEHMDMPGFSQLDQQRLATLVRLHRRKFLLDVLPASNNGESEHRVRLAVLLRLAHLLHRSRSHEELPDMTLSARDQRLTLRVPGSWLKAHPLTELDLQEEIAYLKAAGIELRLQRR